MINIGDMAPDLLGLDEAGNEIKLSQYRGQKVVLYFYPKDSTSGCTAEACSFRDNYETLQQAGYVVIGVSIDSAKSHQNFIAKQNLPFHLIPKNKRSKLTVCGAKRKCRAEPIWEHCVPRSLLTKKAAWPTFSIPRKSKLKFTQNKY